MTNRLPKDQCVIRDTREKEGWCWEEERRSGKINFSTTIEEKIDAGDYTVKGFEDIVRIERKQGFSELFNNLMVKDHRERFERELERLFPIKHKYIIVESSLNEDIMSLSVPQYNKRSSPPGSKLVQMLFEYQIDYGVVPIFAGPCGKRVASRIFRHVVRTYDSRS